jgi:AcrR family transcriptional regulator
MESVGSVPEVKALIDTIRDATSARILNGLGAGDPPPATMRAAARGWLWFMDGAILDWLEHKDMTRTELRDLLLASLTGSLTAAGWSP